MMVATPPREGGPGGQMPMGQMGPGMAQLVMLPPGVAPGGVPPHPPPHPMGPGAQAHRVGGPVPVHSGPPPAADGRQDEGFRQGQGQHGREHRGGMYR
jgi:hypothetical protein